MPAAVLWALPMLPLVGGGVIAVGFRRGAPRRGPLGAAAALVLAATATGTGWAAAAGGGTTLYWGANLTLSLSADAPATAVTGLLVPLVALPIVVYAAAHEDARGLGRLVGGLVAFVGAMLLLVLAADLLTLLIAWELVGAASWGLISHRWWQPDTPGRAAHAFNATRFGDLGLFLAAAAAIVATGSAAYVDLPALDATARHVVAGGVLLAAAAKSAQGPFAPWLFSAMAGPTPVSALLHAATMVAAGGYVLIRLGPDLAATGWFGPTVIAVGLVTALAGGVVALGQPQAKRLLAASTSAQYGLVFVAVGAGSTTAALAHLVAHAALKAPLFLVAGIAISATGSEDLARMHLGRALPAVAWLALPASLALAAVPPLGGAWSKEAVVAAAGHEAAWLAVAVALAGGLSAAYATRFQVLAYGRAARHDLTHPPGTTECLAVGVLSLTTIALSAVWLPGGRAAVEAVTDGTIPASPAWELALSLVLVAAGVGGALAALRHGRLVAPAPAERRVEVTGASTAESASPPPSGLARAAESWLGVVPAVHRGVVDPALALAAALARFDDRIVDAGVRAAAAVGRALSWTLSRVAETSLDGVVRGLAALARAGAAGFARADDGAVDGAVRAVADGTWRLGGRSRALQTGMSHHYYVLVVAGLAVLAVAAAVWR